MGVSVCVGVVCACMQAWACVCMFRCLLSQMLVVCEDCVTAVEETGGEGEVEADGGEMDDAMEGGGEGEEAEAEGACTHSLPSKLCQLLTLLTL